MQGRLTLDEYTGQKIRVVRLWEPRVSPRRWDKFHGGDVFHREKTSGTPVVRQTRHHVAIR